MSWAYNIYREQLMRPQWYATLINPFYIARKRLLIDLTPFFKKMTGRVLDFGCGAMPYRNSFTCKEYIGTDVYVSGHDHSNDKIDVYYDGKTLPFPDNSFDQLFTSQVFEHIENLDDILKELHRVLKPQGLILISVPFCWDEHEVPYDFARYTSYGILSKLKKAGYEIESLKKSGNFIESIAQLWGIYVFSFVSEKKAAVQILTTFFVIAPVTLLGLLLAKLLPNKDSFYLNNIVLARKRFQ